jgi:hypothetical protein
MTEVSTPNPGVTNAPNSAGVVSAWSKVTDYLTKVVTSIYGGASEVTSSAVKYAKQSKQAIDPVISSVGETAKSLSAISLIGAILDRGNKTGLRNVYETSTDIAKDVNYYEDKGTHDLSARLDDLNKTPSQIMLQMSDPAYLPPVREDDSGDVGKGKKKKKKKSTGRRYYTRAPKRATRRK